MYDTALSLTTQEQTNLESSFLWGAGFILRRKVFLSGSRLRRYSPLETIVPKAPSLAHWRQRTSAGPKTLSSHELAFLQDGRVSLKPWTARRDLVRCPVFGVAFTEFANSAYVKTSRSCHTASWAWVGEQKIWGDGTFYVHRLVSRVA